MSCSTHYRSFRAQSSQITRSSANAEEPCEHAVSWNRVKCCINVWRIAFEKACNQWMTFKVIQGHYRCYHLIGYFLLVFHCKYICFLHRFWDINTYLPKNEDVTWPRPRPSKGQFVIKRQALLGPIRAQNLTILSLAIPEKFKGCKILKWITWPFMDGRSSEG